MSGRTAVADAGSVRSPFGARLLAAVDDRGRLCVGIDPHPALLRAWGLADDADGLARFARTVVEALAGEVAVLKPQSAFFERHGSRGIAVLEETVTAARAAGALVLLDVKRGDIGTTAQAYADAYLRADSPIAADAATVSPFLGFGSLRPFLDTAREHGSGVFVLALTSNPEGAAVQRARVVSEDVGGGSLSRTVAGELLDAVRAENAGAGTADATLGSVGAVVGATVDSGSEHLDVGGPLLVPGLGAQGALPADIGRQFGAVARQVLPSASRSVLAAGPDPGTLRSAALRLRDELTAVLEPRSA